MLCRGLVATPAFGYECWEADRIDCLTRIGGSRASAGFGSACQPAQGAGSCRRPGYGAGLSQSILLGWWRRHTICRGVERQAAGHTFVERYLWLPPVPPSPWIRPMGLPRIRGVHWGAYG